VSPLYLRFKSRIGRLALQIAPTGHRGGNGYSRKIHKPYATKWHFSRRRAKKASGTRDFGRNNESPVGRFVHIIWGAKKRANKLTCNINQL
jgi:hypothetical protein